jgi:hypothetical protein
MVVAHVDHVGTYPLQGEDFGEDQHDSGGSVRAAPGADRGHAGTLHG